jgi:hypothetical protein
MQERADEVKAAIQLLIEAGRARRAAGDGASPREPGASKEEPA